MFTIKNRFNGDIICKGETIKAAVEYSSADLRSADLRSADLRSADLSYANLRSADLSYADLRYADLSYADLRSADLSYADLRYAKNVEFYQLPTISNLSSFSHGDLSDDLTLELMRRDAWAHPHPEKFDEWAKGGGCPYQNEDYFWLFKVKRNLWKKGKPQMRDSDLILALCKHHGWKIKGYLE